MSKTWDQMTEAEKLEALRKDIADTASFVNPIAEDVRRLFKRLSEVEARLDEIHKKEQSKASEGKQS